MNATATTRMTARASICRAWTSPGLRCPNPTTNGVFCSLHATRSGFGARFRRTPSHPVYRTRAWRTLAKRTVEKWVGHHGWVCPGWRRAAHSVKPRQLAADHPVPLALGGEPLPVNAGVLCRSCNARKGLSQRRR